MLINMRKKSRKSAAQAKFERDLQKALRASREEIQNDQNSINQSPDISIQDNLQPENENQITQDLNNNENSQVDSPPHSEKTQDIFQPNQDSSHPNSLNELSSAFENQIISNNNQINEDKIRSDDNQLSENPTQSIDNQITGNKIKSNDNQTVEFDQSVYRKPFDLQDPFKPPFFLNAIEKVYDQSVIFNNQNNSLSNQPKTPSMNLNHPFVLPTSRLFPPLPIINITSNSKKPPQNSLPISNEPKGERNTNQINEEQFFEDEDYNDVEVDELNDAISLDAVQLHEESRKENTVELQKPMRNQSFVKPVELIEEVGEFQEFKPLKLKPTRSNMDKMLNYDANKIFRTTSLYLNEFDAIKQKKKQNNNQLKLCEMELFLKRNKIPHYIFNSGNDISDEYQEKREKNSNKMDDMNMMIDMDMIIDAENKNEDENEVPKDKEDTNAFEFEFEYEHAIDHRSNELNDNIYADKNILLNGQDLIKPVNLKNHCFPSNPYEMQLVPYLQSEMEAPQNYEEETIIRANKRGRPGRKKPEKNSEKNEMIAENENNREVSIKPVSTTIQNENNINLHLITIEKPKQSKLNVAEFQRISFVPLNNEEMCHLMMNSVFYDKKKIVCIE